MAANLANPRFNGSLSSSGATWRGGKFGTCVNLSGSSSSIDVGTSKASFADTESHSYSCWIYQTGSFGASYGWIFNLANSDTVRGTGIALSNARQLYWWYNGQGTGLASGYTVPAATWTHIVASYNGATKKVTLYANGIQVYQSSALTFANAPLSTDVFKIGRSSGGGFNFPGSVDNIRVYQRALSSAEIQALYAEPFAGIRAPVRRIYAAQPQQASASLSGSGTLAATAKYVPQASASLSGSGILSATGTLGALYASASLSGSGTLAATATLGVLSVSASLSGSGTLAATAKYVAQASASLSGSGTLASTARYVALASATLSGSGTLEVKFSVSAALSASGTLSGSAWTPVDPPTSDQMPAIYAEPLFSDVIFADWYADVAGNKLTQPSRPGVTIRFFDRSDVLKGVISTNTSKCLLSAMRFELLDTGPGMFELTLASDPPFQVLHDSRVDIHLWNDPDPYYSGAVQSITWPGSTERARTLSGFGYSEHVNRILLDGTWESKYAWEIVRDILKDQVAPNTKVLFDDALIERSTDYLISKFVLQRTAPKDALKQLAALAGGAIYGVNENRRFFWRSPSATITEHLWYGRHVGEITGDLDAAKLANRYWIKLGSIRTDLAPTDPFLKTNWLKEYIESTESQATYGRRDTVYTAPSMLDALDALRAADVDMTNNSVPQNPIRLKDVIFDGQRVTADGNVRVVGVGARELSLPKKKAIYRATGPRVSLELELGALERSPAEWISELTAREALEQLSRQQSQTQL